MPDIKLVSIDWLPRNDIQKFLWSMLRERDPIINISHKEMPTWKKHCEFVDYYPYRDWCIIIHKDRWVGQIYLTHGNEIGIFLLPNVRHQGIGSKAVRRMIKNYGPGRYLANVSSKNSDGIDFFRATMRWKLIQHTFELEVTDVRNT